MDRGLIPLFIIFKSEKVMLSQIPMAALDLNQHFGTSQKEWTSNTLGFKWLVYVFNPITWQNLGNIYIDQMHLLICTRCDSYISAKLVAYCIENNISLFLLLSHFSHLLQRLNVSIFSLLKTTVSVDLDQLIQVRVVWLKKVEWVETYIRTRPMHSPRTTFKLNGAILDQI